MLNLVRGTNADLEKSGSLCSCEKGGVVHGKASFKASFRAVLFPFLSSHSVTLKARICFQVFKHLSPEVSEFQLISQLFF